MENGVRLARLFGRIRSAANALENPRIGSVVLGVLVAALGVCYQRFPFFPDSDAFYHVAMATRIAHGSLSRDFPWLPLTILNGSFADHHLLYHVALVPFITLLPPLTGLKVSVVTFGAFAVIAYFLTLRHLGVRRAFWWTFFMATSWPFLFRLNLVKALPLSLVLYLLGLIGLKEKRHWLVAGTAAVYVWTYGGWPLLPAAAAALVVVRVVRHRSIRWPDLTPPFLAAAGGAVVGLVANPYFPQNVRFYWYQIVQIALTPTASTVVGPEWLPFPPLDLYLSAAPLFIAGFVLVIMWLVRRLTVPFSMRFERTTDDNFLVAMVVVAVGLLAATLLVRRYVEYFIPLGYLALALSFTRLDQVGSFASYRVMFGSWRQRRPFAVAGLLLTLGLLAAMYVGQTLYRLQDQFRDGLPVNYLAASADWMSEHLPPGHLVFNLRWDDFGALLYRNDRERYGVGLDVRFLAGRGERLRQWEQLFRGTASDPVRLLRDAFHADEVFVSYRDTAAAAMLEQHQFPVLYRDAQATIYALPR